MGCERGTIVCARACLIAWLRGIERIEEIFGSLANDKYMERTIPRHWQRYLYKAMSTYPLFVFRAFHCDVCSPILSKVDRHLF